MVGNVPDPLSQLREDFRQQLEVFYARLKLAPPYDSVEKAITRLTANVTPLTLDDQHRLLADSSARWQAYRAAFIESGLHLKHRGIITGLAKQGSVAGLPEAHRILLDVYLT